MENIADVVLVDVFGHLTAAGIAQASRSSRRFLEATRGDALWIRQATRRWRFGTIPSNSESLSPGDRDGVVVNALAHAVQAPLRHDANAFDFFTWRSRLDVKVVALVLQFRFAWSDEPTAVEIRGVSAQLDGCVGVASPNVKGRRSVTLVPSLLSLDLQEEHIIFLEALSAEEIERRLLEMGAEAIDQLHRLCTNARQDHGVGGAAKYLLELATEQWVVAQWSKLMGDTRRVDLLEEGGLVVSQWAEAATDVTAVRQFLTELADAVAGRVSANAPLRQRIEAINTVLFDDFGFAGNSQNYYDPHNSFLSSVLTRRRGIPISLSVVWAVVARRVAVPCFLCSRMPMHIVIRVIVGDRFQDDLYIDAFERRILDYSQLREFLSSLGVQFQDVFVQQGAASEVYSRMMRNLLNIYRESVITGNGQGRLSSLLRLRSTCSQIFAISPESRNQLEPFHNQLSQEIKKTRRDSVMAPGLSSP